jgi:hypothetical protein
MLALQYSCVHALPGISPISWLARDTYGTRVGSYSRHCDNAESRKESV